MSRSTSTTRWAIGRTPPRMSPAPRAAVRPRTARMRAARVTRRSTSTAMRRAPPLCAWPRRRTRSPMAPTCCRPAARARWRATSPPSSPPGRCRSRCCAGDRRRSTSRPQAPSRSPEWRGRSALRSCCASAGPACSTWTPSGSFPESCRAFSGRSGSASWRRPTMSSASRATWSRPSTAALSRSCAARSTPVACTAR